MKVKLLIGVICLVLGALAGYFGPGLIKADAVQEAPVDEAAPELTPVDEAAPADAAPAPEVKPEEKKTE